MDPVSALFSRGSFIMIDMHLWNPKSGKIPDSHAGLVMPKMKTVNANVTRKLTLPLAGNYSRLDRIKASFMEREMTLRAYQFPISKFGWYTSDGALPYLRKRFEEYRANFYKHVATYIDNYPRLRAEAKQQHIKDAHKAYEHMKEHNASKVGADTYVQEVLAQLDKQYPTVNELRAMFWFEMLTYKVQPDAGGGPESLIGIRRRLDTFVEESVHEHRRLAWKALEAWSRGLHESLVTYSSYQRVLAMDVERFRHRDYMGDTRGMEIMQGLFDRTAHYDFSEWEKDSKLRASVLVDIQQSMSYLQDTGSLEDLIIKTKKELGLL